MNLRLSPRALASLAILATFAATAHAQPYTWVGGVSPSSWDNTTNWAGGTVPVSATNTQLVFTFSGGGNLSQNNLGTFTLNQLTFGTNNVTNRAVTGNTLNFTNDGTTNPSIIMQGSQQALIDNAISLTDVALLLTNASGGAVLTFDGLISGNGSLNLNTGVWVLSRTTSTFSGGITLTNGSLVLTGNSTGAAGAVTQGSAGTGKITINSGTLRTANSLATTINNDVDLAGNVTFGSSSPATSKLTLGGTFTLTGNTTRTVTLSGTNPVVLGGVMAGTGSGSALTVLGTGTLELSGTAANTYSGATTLNSANATLLLNKTGATAIAGNLVLTNGRVLLGQANQIATNAVLTNNGGVFDLGGFSQTLASVALTGTATVTNGTLTTSGGTNTVNNPLNSGLTISANLAGTNSLVKTDNGVLYLSGANTYSGGTLIQLGSTTTNIGFGSSTYGVVLRANEALGTGALTIGDAATSVGSARLALNGYNQTVSSLSSGSVGTRVIEANGNEGGVLSTLTVNQATDTAYDGILRDSNSTTSAPLALVKTGAGFLNLTGPQINGTYSGGLTVNGGALGFIVQNSVGTGAITLGGGTLRYTPTGSTNLTITNTFTLTAAATNTLEVTDSSVSLTVANVISGSGALTKTGAGTLTLSRTNIYSGDTAVTAGTLVLATNGSLRFVIGGSGTNNALTGTATAQLNGRFAFDLSSASTNTGATWTIVANTLGATYGTNFLVSGFSGAGGTWTNTTNGVNYVFAQSNGVLQVQSTNPVSNYGSWVSYWTNAVPGFTNTAGTANPDGDPFNNNMEFAFDGNPTIGSPALLTATKVGTNTVFNFVARKNPPGGVTYQVQSTTNLASGPWTTNAVTVSNSANTNGLNIPADYERKEFVVPASGGQFFRVQATIAP
jgi:autotransporter-associated beta strand protein